MIEALQAISAIAAIALPFILYILHGIAHDLRELRGKVETLIPDQAVQRAELDIIKKQLRLMDESPA